MPSHLGKLYVAELVYDSPPPEPFACAFTDHPDDLAKITRVIASSFKTMRTMKSKTIKTLVDTSKGVALITVKSA